MCSIQIRQKKHWQTWQPTTSQNFTPPRVPSSPGGVGDVDSSQVDALTAHDEQRGEAEQGDATADHSQLGRLASSQLQLLDDVATQDDAHAGTGHNNQTWEGEWCKTA